MAFNFPRNSPTYRCADGQHTNHANVHNTGLQKDPTVDEHLFWCFLQYQPNKPQVENNAKNGAKSGIQIVEQRIECHFFFKGKVLSKDNFSFNSKFFFLCVYRVPKLNLFFRSFWIPVSDAKLEIRFV